MFSDIRKQVSTAQKRISFSLEPAPAWAAILALLSLTSLCITVGAGSFVNFAFPVSALGVGVFLYFRYPILYLGFSWWMWLISPFIRRLADYRSDFTDPSPILLTPFLVTFVTFLTVLKNLPKFYLLDSLPCILSLLGVIYGFIVGMIYVDSPLQVGIDSLE
ncbi:MAG: O-antigen ligase domain-containing protein, partial [Xenococcaceae cyanobacterium]